MIETILTTIDHIGIILDIYYKMVYLDPLKGPGVVEIVHFENKNEHFIDILIKANDKCQDLQTEYESSV